MKKLISLLSSAGVMVSLFWGCSDSKGRYLDLSTGKSVEVEKDDATGVMVNKETGDPLYIYVDTKKNDTIYGKTGEVINGHVILTRDNVYVFDEDEKTDGVVNNGDYKRKVEDDGDTKIKNGDSKIKIDDGEKKVKND